MATKEELIKQAEELGIDIDNIEGTGADGAVVKSDIEEAIENAEEPQEDVQDPEPQNEDPQPEAAPAEEEVDLPTLTIQDIVEYFHAYLQADRKDEGFETLVAIEKTIQNLKKKYGYRND